MAHRKLAIIRRRLFTGLSVLSLLLCIATLTLWVRSYWWRDVTYGVRIHRQSVQTFEIASSLGTLDYSSRREPTDERSVVVPGYSYESVPFEPDERPSARQLVEYFASAGATTGWFLGFGFVIVDVEQGASLRCIWLPHWSLALLFAILPAVHLRAAIRLRRCHRAGNCPRRGYDLRATPERCPECGAVPAGK